MKRRLGTKVYVVLAILDIAVILLILFVYAIPELEINDKNETLNTTNETGVEWDLCRVAVDLSQVPYMDQRVLDELNETKWVSVIMTVRDTTGLSFECAETREEKDLILDVIGELKLKTQTEIIASLSNSEFKLEWTDKAGDGFAGMISKEGVEKLRDSPHIMSISKPRIYSIHDGDAESEFEPAPQWVIDKVNDYIVSMVGEDYFDHHIILEKSQTNINLDKSGAKYVLTYIYTHDIKDRPEDDPYPMEHQFVLWADSSGELVEYRGIKYRGPNGPYQFLISKSEANLTAIENGLHTPDKVYLHYGQYGYKSDTPIEEGTYAWVVWTKTCVTKGNIEGLFIDVDTGEIISRKTSTSSCQIYFD